MAVATPVSSSRWITAALAAPFHALVAWYSVSQERAALRTLPAERLADLGLTPHDVQYEASRPFWQAKRDT